MTPKIQAVSQSDTTIVTNTILQFLFLTLSIFPLPDLAHYHANESNLLRVWHSQSMFFVWEISFRIYLHSWQRLFKFCLLCIQSVCAVFAGKITIFVKTNSVFLAQLSHCLKNMRHCCEKFDVIMAGWRKPYILYRAWRFHSMLLFGKYWYILWNMVFTLYYGYHQRNKSTNTTPENLNYMVCSRK